MNGAGTVVVVIGIGVAALLYFRSQQQQANTLASAAATTPPNILERAYNTVAPKAAVATKAGVSTIAGGFRAVGSAASGVAGVTNDVVSFAKGIF